MTPNDRFQALLQNIQDSFNRAQQDLFANSLEIEDLQQKIRDLARARDSLAKRPSLEDLGEALGRFPLSSGAQVLTEIRKLRRELYAARDQIQELTGGQNDDDV